MTMGRRSVWASVVGVLPCALVLTANHALAQPSLTYRTPGDVPACFAAPAASESSEVLVGYASGRIVRLAPAEGGVRPAWEAKADGGILALIEPARPKGAKREVVAGTALGHVVCFREGATEPVWRFASTCEVSCLAEVADVDGDGTAEIVAGGADHRAHLLSGRTGKEIWQRPFQSNEGGGYVMRLLVTSDQDRDGTPDVAVWLWSGELAVVSGRSGKPIWQRLIGGEYTGALVGVDDLDSDGLGDFLVGGNDKIARACSGRDGTILWSGRVDRPIRDIAVVAPGPARSAVAYVCTAGGAVARFDVRKQDETDKPRWTANLGDVCRGVLVTDDADGDGTPDVAACAENGVVVILSGDTGRVLRRWQFADTVRVMCPVSVGGRQHVAVACLDATVRVVPATARDPVRSEGEADAAGTSAARALADKPPVAPGTVAPGSSAARPPVRTGTESTAKTPANSGTPRVLVLLYHDVLPEAVYHYATSVETFRAHMDMLIEEKYTCVSLDQIADWMEGKESMPDRAVCITFDGQYQGQYTYAYPILRKRKLFATSYITTDWIGTPNHSDWDQLREMEAAGVMDVQNHTISHPFLTRCDRSEVIRQLAVCNEAIARHMNGKIARHHTYPSGANNPSVREIVREQGFRTATTVRAGAVTRKDDLMGVPRYMLCIHRTPEEFRAWLAGRDVPLPHNAGRGTE